ncbi:TetR family transcriptional regulator [Frondihabitans australicus]|uniref:TetR family transcriptional regulator n=1 Tax=Frondihabitans australicus TaxID=386892 RepID=A0A495ILA0_9MICO|nr:TetR family transcriptional regulator [Frondihabitans australicus]
MPPSRRRPGRPPGRRSTRDAVLAAARARFAADGFAQTTIRSVAADAGVDGSQVIQFFRSKEELFAAVMAVPASALARFDEAFEGPAEQRGELVVRAFFDSWEQRRDESEPLMATLRGAFVNERARQNLSEFIQSRLLDGGGRHGDEEAVLRAGLAASLLVGVVTSRTIIGVPAIESASLEDLVRLLAPAVQAIL